MIFFNVKVVLTLIKTALNAKKYNSCLMLLISKINILYIHFKYVYNRLYLKNNICWFSKFRKDREVKPEHKFPIILIHGNNVDNNLIVSFQS